MAEARPRRKRAGKWGYVAIFVAVVAVAVFLVYSAIGPKKSTTQYTTQAVTKGTLSVTVAGNGNVVSANSASVNPNVSGTVRQLSVSLGDHVKKGELLFVIDNSSLDASVKQAKSSYQQAQSSTSKAKQAKTQANVSLSTGVTQSQQALEQAQASVYTAQAALVKAQSAVPVDQNAVNAAQENLDAANANVKTAQKNYDNSKTIQNQGYDAASKSYTAAVTAQQAAYLNYQQAIDNAAQRKVTAPIDGFITTLSITNGDQVAGGASSSSRSSSSGSSASSGSSGSSSGAPIVISNMSNLEAQVSVAETDRSKVKVGQDAQVTFDAVPGLTITGKVASIDAVGTSTQGVVTYGVTISFDVQNSQLNPGMTAAASIVTKVVPDALLVPNAAVKTDTSGASYVQVLASGSTTPQNLAVTTGASNDTQTQITSGVTEGQEVVTSSSGSSSSSSSRSGFSVIGGGGGFRGGFRGGP